MNSVRVLVFSIFLLVLCAFAPNLEAQCFVQAPELEIVSVSEPGSTGLVTVSVRRKNVTVLDVTWQGVKQTNDLSSAPNPYGFDILLSCMTAPSDFIVEASNCAGQARQSRSLGPLPDTGSVSVTAEERNGVAGFHVSLTNPFATITKVRSHFFPLRGEPEMGQDGPVSSLDSYTATRPGTLKVIATWCPGRTDGDAAPSTDTVVDCHNCVGSCVQCPGDPVQVTNGNMRFTETDPIPGAPVVPFRRHYDSRVPESGWFGPGTTTFLDPRLYVGADGADAVAYVSLMDEDGHGYVFEKKDDTYRQFSPRPGSQPTRLLHDASGEWRHVNSDGRIARVFNAEGRLLRYVDQRTGRATLIDFNSLGRPTAVRDSWQTWSWTLTYDATIQRITRISVDGHPDIVWEYGYGSNQNHVVRVESPAGTWRRYDVTPTPFGSVVSAVRDGTGTTGHVLESHSFDGAQRATTSYGPSGEISQFSYELSGRIPGERATRITWASGAIATQYLRWIAGQWRTVEIIGGCTSCGTKNTVYVHDSVTGNVLREQDSAGYITENAYWNTGRLFSRRTALKPLGCEPATQSCRQTVEDLATIVLQPTAITMRTEYTYSDALWPERPTTIRTTGVLSGDRVESFTYHPVSGEVGTHSVTGATGQPVRQETRVTTTSFYNGTEGALFAPGGGFDPAWVTLPQPAYLRKSIDGPRTDVTDVTSVVYYPIDPAVPLDWRGRLASSRNALGHITRYENYDVYGNARRVVDPNGNVTESTYDGLGRQLTSTVKALINCNTSIDPRCGEDLTSSRTYYGAGPLATEVRPLGGTTVYGYDDRGRVTTVSRGPSVTNLLERIETGYDVATGKKSIERAQAFESGGWATKKSEGYGYDVEGRVTTLVHRDSTEVRYTHDVRDQVLTVQDENHTTPNTFYTYDAAGRQTRVEQTLASAPGGRIATAYTYDLAGNLTAVTDPNGNTTTYLYDDFGQMLRQVSPVTGTTTYAYNVAGQLTSSTDANGATTTRRYDVLGRLISTDSIRGTDREQVAWGYDAAGNLGRLAFMSDPTGYTSYYYTRLGQLRAEQKNIDGTVYTIQRHYYDADGNDAAITYPSNRTFIYTFDYAGRPTGLTINGVGTQLVSNARYLPFGPLTDFTYGSGDKKVMAYDFRYRVAANQLLRNGNEVASYTYQYDPAGNITGITDTVDAAYNRQFGYDDLGRLTSTSTGAMLWGTRTLTYDAMGNIKKTTLGATVNHNGSLPNVTSVTESGATTPVTYDPAGNELTGLKSSTLSPRNNIVHMSSAAMDYLYKYDGRGVRTWTSEVPKPATSTTTKRYHFYTPDLRFLARTDYTVTATGTTIARTIEPIWFAGMPVAQIDYNDLSTLRYTFTDHLGTPILQTNASGAIIWRLELEPYGRPYRIRTGSESAQPLRLPGQELAGDGKENYNIFRWYRSSLGRYTQADPIGTSTDVNLYRYVENRPLTAFDPVGLQLYVPGPPPAADPLFPLRPPCPSSPWTFVTHATFDRGERGIWSLTRAVEISVTLGTGQGAQADALSTGWCRCFYTLTAVVRLYRTYELWQRTTGCCGTRGLEYRSQNVRDSEVAQDLIYDPRALPTRTTIAPMLAGECGCATTMRGSV